MNNSAISSAAVTFWGRSRYLKMAWIIVLLAAAIVFRVGHLDPPSGFETNRLIRSEAVSRQIYIQFGGNPGTTTLSDAEPRQDWLDEGLPAFEGMTAFIGKILGHQSVEIGYWINIILWFIGAVVLYDLAKRWFSIDGVVTGLGFYLLLPYTVIYSRSFLPEPFAVVMLLFFLNLFDRWQRMPNWVWAVLAGISGGAAGAANLLLILPICAVVMSSMIFSGKGRDRKTRGSLALIFCTVAILPIVLNSRGLPGLLFHGEKLLLQPRYYFLFFTNMNHIFDLGILLIALIGLLLLPGPLRKSLAIFWAGYFLSSIVFPELFASSTGIHIVLLPAVAISLAALGEIVFNQLAQRPILSQAVLIAVLLLLIGYLGWFTWTVLEPNSAQYTQMILSGLQA